MDGWMVGSIVWKFKNSRRMCLCVYAYVLADKSMWFLFVFGGQRRAVYLMYALFYAAIEAIIPHCVYSILSFTVLHSAKYFPKLYFALIIPHVMTIWGQSAVFYSI